MVYQIFTRVSPYHFKTRLLDIGYLESGQQAKPWLTTAFFIEDISDAAARTEMEQKIVVKADRRKLDHSQTAIVEMFQFFIGNTDYSTLAAREGDDCCHNMRLVGRAGEDALFPVPYDFDSAGFVDAPMPTRPSSTRSKKPPSVISRDGVRKSDFFSTRSPFSGRRKPPSTATLRTQGC